MNKDRPKLLICDFDGCLYPYPDDSDDIFKRAMIKTGHEISGGAWSQDMAIANILNSFNQHGIGFKDVAAAFNISMAEANLIHHRNTVFDLQRDERLINALQSIDRSRVIPMVLTQASRCHLDRHMPQIGIEHEIPRNLCVTANEHGFDRLKHNSDYPWQFAKWRAEQVTGLTFQDADIYVFEDTTKNLIRPYQMGWNTIYIHHDKPLETLPVHIHTQESHIARVMRKFPQKNTQAAKHLTHPNALG